MQVSRLVAVGSLLVLLASCAPADSTSSPGPIATTPADASPEAAAMSPEPTVEPGCPDASAGCPGQQPEPALGEPLTTVPESVMLTPGLQRTGDTTAVGPWALAYCGPGPQQPDAATMRSRTFRGPAATPETGPLGYTQQVAAFSSVDAAAAEAVRLVDAAERCPAASQPAGPAVGLSRWARKPDSSRSRRAGTTASAGSSDAATRSRWCKDTEVRPRRLSVTR